MALQGNLEDLPLLDIIQIVSFSKKTGYLHVRMEGGDGAIVFREGLVVSAFTANSPAADPRLATLAPASRDTAVRRRLGFALDALARLREGAFGFELTDAVPETVGKRDIRLETLVGGINPQEMLLALAQGMDDDRAQSAAAVEASFATPTEGMVAAELAALVPPVVPSDAVRTALAEEPRDPAPTPPSSSLGEFQAPPVAHAGDTRPVTRVVRPNDTSPALAAPPRVPVAEPPAEAAAATPPPTEPPGAQPPAAVVAAAEPVRAARTILLVDDEQDVREVLARHFGAAGFEIVEGGDPEEAAKLAARLRSEDKLFVLVTDLGMPASGGASFQGGFEVVKRLWKMNLRPPVLMMTESLNQSLRLRARQ
ncbi:MAG TPA: DUF4388 domain-containing protein, partial [Vicinamibacteria bacterium]